MHLQVACGEILGLLGRSGSGKSMTLQSIAGIRRPDKGIISLGESVFFDGKEKIDVPVRERNIGYLFQSSSLFPKMTVLENVESGVKEKQKRDELSRSMLSLLHIEEFSDRYPHELSGGQQQRVALARMLASTPSLLLLDEPFSALDQASKDEIDEGLLKVLRSFAGPVVFVSHNREEVRRYCTRTLFLENGALVPYSAT
jgi:molybdate transport system ATP-binding protein